MPQLLAKQEAPPTRHGVTMHHGQAHEHEHHASHPPHEGPPVRLEQIVHPESKRRLSRESSDEGGRQTKFENAKIGASKAIRILEKMQDRCFCVMGDDHGELSLQHDSVYGAAVVLPQVARSCEWPGTLIAAVIRTYFFCLLNFTLQAFLLSMIGEEQHFWYPFGGKMHLCDFGASIQDCPGAPNCVGPGGTVLSYPRLYDYDIWSTRTFVKQSLQVLFPASMGNLDSAVDPGEYGLESFSCRCLCIGLFMLAVVDDLEDAMNLFRTLVSIPTEYESWISLDIPDWCSKEDIKQLNESEEKDFIRYEISGIPLHWKLFNAFFILLPKCMLWLGLVRSGVHYLMETAGIMNTVVNAMALTFILQVDEILFQRLSSSVTTEIMSKLEFKALYDLEEVEQESDADALAHFEEVELKKSWGSILFKTFPTRLFIILVLQTIFLLDYYVSNCDRLEDGSWVSKAMRLPADMGYNPLALMFGWETVEEPKPFWTMQQ